MKKTLSVLLLATACLSAHAAVPFTFQAGQPAKAAEVNQNFQNLDQRVSSAVGGLSVDRFTATDQGSGVSAAVCPASSEIVGVGCVCDSVNGARNFGILFSCNIVGNGGLVGCYADSATFNPNKPAPQATVTIECLNATNGNVAGSSSKASEDIDAAAEVMRVQVSDREAALRHK